MWEKKDGIGRLVSDEIIEKPLTGRIDAHPSCLLHQQLAGGDVPGVNPKLEVDVRSSACYHGHVKGSWSKRSNATPKQSQFLDYFKMAKIDHFT